MPGYRDIARREEEVFALEPPADPNRWFLALVGGGFLLAGVAGISLVGEFGVSAFILPLSGVVILVLGIRVGVRKRTPPRLVLDELEIRFVSSGGRVEWWGRREEVQVERAWHQESTDPPVYLPAVVLKSHNGELPIGVADGVGQRSPLAREVRPYLFVSPERFSDLMWLLAPRPPK